MDTLRGAFGSDSASDRSWDAIEEDESAEPAPRQLPPEAIGQDERRMQVRAYNHWASLLGERMFPSIEDLDPANLPDFGPHSVLLDFSYGIENPGVRYLGEKLAAECGTQGVITRLSDVPPRSLLSRITDHYMQILANQAPIGFEAEFVNHAGIAILYRGILLPYSSDDETIDFIYGVINWKEMADQLTADELLLEIDQALELGSDLELEEDPAPRAAEPVTDWADSPAHEHEDEAAAPVHAYNDFAADFADLKALSAFGGTEDAYDDDALPDFSQYSLGDDDEEYDEDEGEGESAGYNFASLADYIEAPAKKAIDLTGLEPMPFAEEEDEDEAAAPAYGFVPEPVEAPIPAPVAAPVAARVPVFAAADDVYDEDEDEPVFADDLPEDAGLYDCLAAARELARAADSTEDRSRSALYAAVSRAYDFSLAAADAPEDYAELIAESGLTVQDRAPMTPVVKLVFGHDYDKTRLTEYAAVLTHAHRLKLARGTLAGFLAETEGGVKAVVKAERRLRREEQGKPVEEPGAVREALAAQLRALEAITLEHLDGAGPEFALVLIRRDEIGCAEILAELPEDIAQIERAARKLAG
ncbi:hypothetical protein [Porphyrobacter sp. CACIAM 03H1]|uniref:PAS domain-containing protein n=1 Tax=Porphyrobacter sp. CACIAM 03H1 TaxID=2003315 RepID=UPI000B5A5D96|nr:hypothetical protein [Porphyrobacter sp. CACIAM 03H1]ASJ89967.1 hypothetical protein CBR61_02780 [Porphyrobacter sp. CACIAM 03H1]